MIITVSIQTPKKAGLYTKSAYPGIRAGAISKYYIQEYYLNSFSLQGFGYAWDS